MVDVDVAVLHTLFPSTWSVHRQLLKTCDQDGVLHSQHEDEPRGVEAIFKVGEEPPPERDVSVDTDHTV